MIKYIAPLLLCLRLTTQINAQEDSTATEQFNKIKLDYGGTLPFNYNLSYWKPNQVKRGGDFGFEVFRINVDAIYKKWEFHIDQHFYGADFDGAFLKHGYSSSPFIQ